MASFPSWYPDFPPIYNPDKTYDKNFEKGPFFDAKIPIRTFRPKEQWIDFLGYKIASPIGIPAGPLLNANWTLFAAQMGFDVLTYKTIRSDYQPCHPLPNMIYVDAKGNLTKESMGKEIYQREQSKDITKLAVTNSFGMPSQKIKFVMEDIEKVNKNLQKGQIMIVSVVATPRKGEDFIQDFRRVTAIAKEAGAKIVEANFSCPNVSTGEGSIYDNVEAVYTIAKNVKEELKNIPLIIKVGCFTDAESMKQTYLAAAKAGVQGICGLNTLKMKVLNKQRFPALGKNRITSGICGAPIHQEAVKFVQQSIQINKREKLGLTILGTGGVVLPEQFDDFLQQGATLSMTATGMMWDPFLAMKYHEMKKCCD